MSVPVDFEGAVEFARDLIRIPSPSGSEGAVAERVAEEFGKLGFEDVRLDEVGNVLGIVRGRGDGPSVMLNCHLDVVAEGDPEEWEYPPFGAVVEDGFLHGRGAMDIKGPLALQTYAAAALAGQAPGDVIVAHTVFEERGGLGMKHLMESGGVLPDAVVIGESTNGDICIGHRGRAEVEIVLRGLAGHASAPDRARNALDLLPGTLQAVRRLAEGQPTDPVLGTATVVCTDVSAIPASRNVIPDQVVVVLDWRILPSQDRVVLLDDVRALLREVIGDPPEGLSFEVRMAQEEQGTYTGLSHSRDLFTPGFLLEPEHPVARAAAQAVGVRGGSGSATVRPWAFATDGGWSCGIHGVPTVGFAPGEERHAHTNRERLDLEQAEWALGRYPELVLAIQAALPPGRGTA